jgi:hypothetical protein
MPTANALSKAEITEVVSRRDDLELRITSRRHVLMATPIAGPIRKTFWPPFETGLMVISMRG